MTNANDVTDAYDVTDANDGGGGGGGSRGSDNAYHTLCGLLWHSRLSQNINFHHS